MSTDTPARGDVDAFASVASLFLPLGGTRGSVVQAGPRWDLDADIVPADAQAIVWGRLPGGTATPRGSLQEAVARERALRRLRRDGVGELRATAVHRLFPPRRRGRNPRRALQAVVKAGALVELTADGCGPRAIDAVVTAAGGINPPRGVRRGAGGAVLARARHLDGTEVLLRMAPAGSAGDPARTASALRALRAAGVGLAPALRAAGRFDAVSWSCEQLVPGSSPARLAPQVARDVVTAWTELPRADDPPAAPVADLEGVQGAFPHHAERIGALVRDLESALHDLPAVLRHGDLWRGNLIVRGRRLGAVVDWDAMHPAGLPGADLLQLFASEQRLRRRQSLGAAWLTRPWTTAEFRALTAPYWSTFGMREGPSLDELIAIAWWAAEVAGTLSRAPWRAADERWVGANIDPVLAAIGFAG